MKIINTERISDGIDRIELVAGDAVLDYFRKLHSTVSEAAAKLNSDPFKLSEKISSLDEENRRMRKELQELNEVVAEQTAKSLSSSDKIDKELDVPRAMLRSIATKVVSLNDSAVVLLRNRAGEAVCVSGPKSKVSALDFIKEKAGSRKFVGGGSQKFAEGKIV